LIIEGLSRKVFFLFPLIVFVLPAKGNNILILFEYVE